jgi:hypothetical protein
MCRKIMVAKYFRILKLLVTVDIDPQPLPANKIKLASGQYKAISAVTSKEFRLMLLGKERLNVKRLNEDIDDYTSKEYFAQIRRLTSTKHKNTLLRIWNGDSLSNSRLAHYGIVNSNRCPKCNALDTREHMLIGCVHANRVWSILIGTFPKSPRISMMQYAIGINDSRTILMVKAEILKYLMHFRELEPETVINKTKAFLKSINSRNMELADW